MTVQYNSTSPYAETPQTSWYLGIYKDRSIPPSPTDTIRTLEARYEYRPDLLSNDLYGTPLYWWVFYVRNINIIRDPIWDFKAGIRIYTPSSEYLKRVIG